MEIYCTSCQRKLQIADTAAGQVVQCPFCAASFQAPALPALGTPAPGPLAPPIIANPVQGESPMAAAGVTPPPTPPTDSPAFATAIPPPPSGELSRSTTYRLRQDITGAIPTAGLLILFVLSFFTWRYFFTPALDTLTLWQLAFSSAGDVVFLIYLLLLILALPVTILSFCTERKVFAAPPVLQPYLPWAPLVAANLTLAAWLFFLIRYVQFTFFEAPDLASIWMKIAFRLHAIVAAAAFLDIWLRNRARRGVPEPRVTAQW